jgi:hypothetical protein
MTTSYAGAAIRTYASFIGMMLGAACIYCTADFNPSWGYLAVLALTTPFAFFRIRTYVDRKQQDTGSDFLRNANRTSLAVLATGALMYFLAMPTGEFITWSLGTTTSVIGTPVQRYKGAPSHFCRTMTLVTLPSNEQVWACGTTTPDLWPHMKVRLSRSVLGYYARRQG